MAVMTEKMLVVRKDKAEEFAAIMRKPMISKAFLKKCEKSAKSIKGIKS